MWKLDCDTDDDDDDDDMIIVAVDLILDEILVIAVGDLVETMRDPVAMTTTKNVIKFTYERMLER